MVDSTNPSIFQVKSHSRSLMHMQTSRPPCVCFLSNSDLRGCILYLLLLLLPDPSHVTSHKAPIQIECCVHFDQPLFFLAVWRRTDWLSGRPKMYPTSQNAEREDKFAIMSVIERGVNMWSFAARESKYSEHQLKREPGPCLYNMWNWGYRAYPRSIVIPNDHWICITNVMTFWKSEPNTWGPIQ